MTAPLRRRPKPPPLGKVAHLPIDSRHTMVLGYGANGAGKHLWAALDWSAWWIDGPGPNPFNPGGLYLHVRVKYCPLDDGPKKGNRRWYRVRCRYAGGRYRGVEVADVGIGCEDGRLHWIVRMEA